MKPFSTAIQFVKDIERMDKFQFAERMYSEGYKILNERLVKLKQYIKHYEENGDALANQRKYDYYLGLVSAYNFLCEKEDRIESVLEVPVDRNNQPMWLEEMIARLKNGIK